MLVSNQIAQAKTTNYSQKPKKNWETLHKPQCNMPHCNTEDGFLGVVYQLRFQR